MLEFFFDRGVHVVAVNLPESKNWMTPKHGTPRRTPGEILVYDPQVAAYQAQQNAALQNSLQSGLCGALGGWVSPFL